MAIEKVISTGQAHVYRAPKEDFDKRGNKKEKNRDTAGKFWK